MPKRRGSESRTATVPARPMPAWADGRRHRLPRPRRRGRWLLIAIGLVALVVYAATPDPPLSPGDAPISGSPERIVDGDTLDLDGRRIRLAGIDAPELQQTCGTPAGADWACGAEAREALRTLAAGSIDCEPSGTDRYGRTLATCRRAGRDVAAALVDAGLALGNERYSREEDAARASGRGIWQGRFVAPADWRRDSARGEDGPVSNPSRFERFLGWLAALLSG